MYQPQSKSLLSDGSGGDGGENSPSATAPNAGIPFVVAQPKYEEVDGSLAWRDRPWAIAFMIHFGCVCFLAFFYGTKAVSADALSGGSSSVSKGSFDLNADVFIRALVIGSFCAAITTILLFSVLRRLAGGLIRASILVSGSVQILAGAGLIASGLFIGGVLVLTGLLAFAYYWCARSRIAFAAAHVTIATRALDKASGLWLVAAGCLIAQLLWSFIWGLAALGVEYVINNNNGKTATTSGSTATTSDGGFSGTLSTFLMLISYFWGSIFIRNVAAFTAASVVGDYWWKGDTEKAPTMGAVRRALTTSFGSLSLSALLVSVVRAAQAIAKAKSKEARRDGHIAIIILACLAQCIISVLAAILEWANQWAIVFCALTGLAFKPAGLSVWTLFKRRGFDMIVNDDLVGSALSFASLVSAAVGALSGGALAYALDTSEWRVFHAGTAAVLCFFIAMMLASVIASFVETATRAVFVSWALSPGVSFFRDEANVILILGAQSGLFLTPSPHPTPTSLPPSLSL